MYIFKNRHLELEITLAIPVSNDKKYNWNNATGQGLEIRFEKFVDGENDHEIRNIVWKMHISKCPKTIFPVLVQWYGGGGGPCAVVEAACL